MTRWLSWFPPVAMLVFILLLDLHRNQQDVSVPYPLAHRLVALFVFIMVSFTADYALRVSTDRIQPYLRQFTIFGLILLVVSIKDWYVCQTADQIYTWWMCVAGIAIGLFASGLPLIFGSRHPSFGWRYGTNKRPDATRPLIIVADPHWRNNLTGLQEASYAMPDADWLFLGDVFDVWVGIKGFETDAQRNFIWWVSERRRTGHWVGLWLGNRDYFFDGMLSKFDFVGEGTEGKLQGEPFVFEHGDLINTLDRQYRFWSFLSRSAPVWVIANLIPSCFGTKLTAFLERKLQSTNKGNKTNFPTNEFQRAIYDSKAEFFISGHFHTHEETDKGISIPWAHEGKFLLWHDGKFRAYCAEKTVDTLTY